MSAVNIIFCISINAANGLPTCIKPKKSKHFIHVRKRINS